MQEATSWWKPIAHFFGHTVVGLLLFALVAAPAVGLDYLVEQIIRRDLPVSPPIVWSIQALEYFILLCDVFLFLVYFGKKTLDAAKEFWS